MVLCCVAVVDGKAAAGDGSMQRVDVVLDQRLREAIATVVQEQTRSVLPRLREEIESVVRHAVYEAVADELASGQK